MTLGMIFWILLIVAFVFGGWGFYRDRATFAPSNWLYLILLLILGWAEFGSPVK